MESWYIYLIVGLGSGIFSASFGVGSGIILIPALVLLCDIPQKSAQGICLAVMVPMALVGAIRYKMNPEIDMNLPAIVLLSCGAVVGALFGAAIAGWASGLALRRLFAVIMIVVAVKMLLAGGAPRPGPPSRGPAVEQGAPSPPDHSPG